MIAADVRGALQLRTNYFLINYAQKGNAFVTFLGIRLVIAPYSCAKKEGRKEGRQLLLANARDFPFPLRAGNNTYFGPVWSFSPFLPSFHSSISPLLSSLY
jgi:hypothetical protein